MRRTRKLVAAGCLCMAMAMGMTAFAMPGATSLVTVTPKTASSDSSNDMEQNADNKTPAAAPEEKASKTANGTSGDKVTAGAAPLTVASSAGVASGTPGSDEAAPASESSEAGTEGSQETEGIKETAENQDMGIPVTGVTPDQKPEEAISQAAMQMAAASPTKAPSPYEDVAVSKVNGDEDYVNIRDAASVEGEILGKIYNNCAATIEETVETEDGTWYKIHSGSVDGYIKAEYFVTGDEAEALALEIGKMFGYVEEGGLRVRTEPTTESEIITTLWAGEKYTVVEQADGFVKLSLGDDDDGNPVTGYVAEEYVQVYVKFDKAISLEEEEEQKEEARRRAAEAEAAKRSSAREAVVAYAKQFIGNPYVWGGSSLTNGTDCSGFTRSVLGHFGYGLSRTSSAQSGDGRQVPLNSVEPGDLIFYASGGRIYHVALYIGGGRIIHAIDEAHGIGISSMYWTTPVCAVDVMG
ncbi:MAG: SH3 domain-containing protein [Lachnospiraceae bacterium]|nr:SH3 domain-containing protein [Lachnospiraceae bacterium]